jgi:uncharacterized membrane protein
VDDTGWHGATIGVVTLAVVASVALPLLALRRLRNADQRRDVWLSANAQPRLTGALYIFFTIAALAAGLVSALIANHAYPLAWAVVALSAGIVVWVIIYSVASVRTPPDLD